MDIVIGARSASFKQEEGARYNARDMALSRGKLESAQVIMLGPAMAPINNKSRWQLLLKSRSRPALRKLAIAALSDIGHFDGPQQRFKNVRIVIDVDPINML